MKPMSNLEYEVAKTHRAFVEAAQSVAAVLSLQQGDIKLTATLKASLRDLRRADMDYVRAARELNQEIIDSTNQCSKNNKGQSS